MTRSKAVRRRILTLLVGVQGLGAFVPLADALLERSVPGVVHIEERSSRSCPPVHVHADCALCQHLAHRHLADVPPVCVPVDVHATAARPAARTNPPAAPQVPLERGRSPPIV